MFICKECGLKFEHYNIFDVKCPTCESKKFDYDDNFFEKITREKLIKMKDKFTKNIINKHRIGWMKKRLKQGKNRMYAQYTREIKLMEAIENGKRTENSNREGK